MAIETSAETPPKESCRLYDGVVWTAYRFDGLGNYFKKGWDLREDRGNHFCWYHGELPNRNQKLRSFKKIFTEKLCPPLKHQDITRMVSSGPFCGHVDGALFLRVNSSGPSLSNFRLRLAARITENSVITMSLGPNLRLGFSPENPNLVRSDEMGVELDEIVIEKGDRPENSNLVRNEEKGVAAKNGIEEGDVESRFEMNEEEADNLVVKTVGNLLVHIVNRHMDHLQCIVTNLEIDLDTIEEWMEWLWENIEARRKIGGGTVKREMWDDRRLAKMHLDLQRLLQVIAHVEQVFPRIEENFSQKSWWILPDNVNDLRAVINRLGRLKENVGFIGSRVEAIQAGFDSRQTALDSKQAAQINQKLYYLSILSVILLPLSFITGIFGLSVGGIPWKDHEDGFRNVLLICAVMTAVLLAVLLAWRTFRVLYGRMKNRVCNYE
ncbi:uncharacterized protein LOC131218749 isoform X1 [Magnolia sinica]|uniref:uncharacterized protein LOC131218749 isoform X1 n=1 Tax=Magnolia sinica TaxID=86752 RepID=UPI00265A4EAC|nr:uncharacterized protein LOC131218749 isoform X1 [Magnolia sinica]